MIFLLLTQPLTFSSLLSAAHTLWRQTAVRNPAGMLLPASICSNASLPFLLPCLRFFRSHLRWAPRRERVSLYLSLVVPFPSSATPLTVDFSCPMSFVKDAANEATAYATERGGDARRLVVARARVRALAEKWGVGRILEPAAIRPLLERRAPGGKGNSSGKVPRCSMRTLRIALQRLMC